MEGYDIEIEHNQITFRRISDRKEVYVTLDVLDAAIGPNFAFSECVKRVSLFSAIRYMLRQGE